MIEVKVEEETVLYYSQQSPLDVTGAGKVGNASKMVRVLSPTTPRSRTLDKKVIGRRISTRLAKQRS